MTLNNGLPTYSIVIEWENALLSELGRTQEMLKRLHKQIAEVEYPRPDVIILYDKDHVDRQLIEKVVGEVSELGAWPAEVRIIPTDGLEYYEQKNFGAQQTNTDLIIFLDSDVIPERGWLAGLLEAFENPDVQVVVGNSYISVEGFYSKAFASFWFFPLRDEGKDLVRANYFFANNVAFRRETFEAFQYPNLPSFRGQCVALKEDLREHGVDIFLQQRSRVSHPPPNGLRHFVSRALCAGYNQVITYDEVTKRVAGNRRTAPLVTSSALMAPFALYLYYLGQSVKRIAQRYQDVQLGTVGTVGAVGVAACYHTLKLIGALVSHVRPDLIRRHFPI